MCCSQARLCCRGEKDTNKYDVSEISTPVADQNDIRAILSYANKYWMSLRQLDVKSAFLHGELEKPVYIWQFLKDPI